MLHCGLSEKILHPAASKNLRGMRTDLGEKRRRKGWKKGVKLIFTPSLQKIESGNRHALIKIPEVGFVFRIRILFDATSFNN